MTPGGLASAEEWASLLGPLTGGLQFLPAVPRASVVSDGVAAFYSPGGFFTVDGLLAILVRFEIRLAVIHLRVEIIFPLR